MEIKTIRPISVWIAQIVMILCSVGFLFSLFYVFFLNSGVGIGSLVGLAIMLVINLGLSSLFIVAFWGMAMRRAYGRWLGVIVWLTLTLALSKRVSAFFSTSDSVNLPSTESHTIRHPTRNNCQLLIAEL